MKKTLLALFLLLALLTLSACTGMGSGSASIQNENKNALTVSLVTQVIYRDSAGELYYVNVDSTKYSQTIGASSYNFYYSSSSYPSITLHSFTKKAPDKIQGFTVSVERTPVNDPETQTPNTTATPDLEDPFPHQTVAPGTSFPPSNLLRIFDKQTVYVSLKSQNDFSAFLNAYFNTVYGIPSSSENDSGQSNWSEYQQSFAENNALDVSFTYNDYKYHIVIKLETFTYRESVETTYTFAKEYSITKTPYYDSETGELTAHYVTITTTGDSGRTSTLSFYEYE